MVLFGAVSCGGSKVLVVLNLFLSLSCKCCFEMLFPGNERSAVKGRPWRGEGRLPGQDSLRPGALYLIRVGRPRSLTGPPD